jgi:hypothetical protein
MINIKGRKAEVLAKLYNAARAQGLWVFHYTPKDMTIEEAEELLKTQTYFDYLNGRVMKVNLSKDEMFEGLYDRDNGQGAALRAIESK